MTHQDSDILGRYFGAPAAPVQGEEMVQGTSEIASTSVRSPDTQGFATMQDRVEFEVVGGMCRLQFGPASSCGRDGDCNPGVAFTLIGDSAGYVRDGKHYSGMGVFSRTNALRLRDMLNAFLEQHPPPPPRTLPR